MNEIFFFVHVFVLLFFLLLSLKLGKEALIIFTSLQTIFANLFVTKQMDFFSFTITCSDVYIVSAVFGLNLVQEYFGKKNAKKTLYLSLLFQICFMIVSILHLLYIPSIQDQTHDSFVKIFQNTPRIIIASIAVFFLVQRFDIFFYGLLKKKFEKKTIVMRLGFSSIISQFIDTVLFTFLGLYMIAYNVWDVILVSFFIKFLTILASGVFVSFTYKIFMKREVRNELF